MSVYGWWDSNPQRIGFEPTFSYQLEYTRMSIFSYQVGMIGLEPATSCSQSTRATNCATSRDGTDVPYYSVIHVPDRQYG